MKRGADALSVTTDSRPTKESRIDDDFASQESEIINQAQQFVADNNVESALRILLTFVAEQGAEKASKAFLAIWERHHENPRLLEAILEPDMFRQLLDATTTGSSEPFMAIWNKYHDEPRIFDALCQSGVFWLAQALKNSHPEAFTAVWAQYNSNPVFLDALLVPAGDVHYVDKSALWWLARATTSTHEEVEKKKGITGRYSRITSHGLNAQRNAFSVVFQKVKERPKILEALKGEDHTSVLLLCAQAAQEGSLSPFMSVWEICKDNPEILKYLLIQDDEDDGVSALSWLAWAVVKGYSVPFASVWHKYQHAPEMLQGLSQHADDVYSSYREGCKGISALGWLAIAVIYGNSQAFMNVFHKFKDDPTFFESLVVSEDADDNEHYDASAIGRLANAVAENVSAPFLAIWDKFKDEPRLLDALLVRSEYGESGFSWLANAENPEIFMMVWEKYKDDPRLLKALVACDSDFNSSDTSTLWGLVEALKNGRDKPFWVVWHKFKDDKRLLDALLDGMEHSDHESAFWLLAKAAASGRPAACLAVYAKLEDHSQMFASLFQWGYGDEPEKISVLRLLVKAAESEPLIEDILRNIFTQRAGMVSPESPEFQDLINAKIASAALLHARNAFIELFNELQSKDEITPEEMECLFETAQRAQAAGYVNAYYEIGHVFELASEFDVAFRAYQLLSRMSPYQSRVSLFCADHAYGMALNVKDNPALRDKYLRVALEWTLKIRDPKVCLPMLRKIALSYVGAKIPGNVLGSEIEFTDAELAKFCEMRVEDIFAKLDVVKAALIEKREAVQSATTSANLKRLKKF